MALKRELSQQSASETPPRKAPRLTLAVNLPVSPDPTSTGPTESPTDDDRIPVLPASPPTYPVPRPTPWLQLDPVQLVARLEDLAAEYERSVDEMGAEIEELKRQVNVAERRLEAASSLEDCRVMTFHSSKALQSKRTHGKGTFEENWTTYKQQLTSSSRSQSPRTRGQRVGTGYTRAEERESCAFGGG